MGDSRNERMGERGEGRGTMSARSAPSLEPKTAALVRIAAAIAAGKTAELEPRLGAARGAGVPVLWIEELLLQSLLVVGYPLALVAFGVWRKVSGPLPDHGSGHDAEQLAHADWEAWAERGAVAAVAVLGTAPQQLHSHLRGALNTGATREEVEAVLALIEGDLDPVHRQRAHDQWADVKKRKV